MMKQLENGCLILIVVFVVLAIAYMIWAFSMMS